MKTQTLPSVANMRNMGGEVIKTERRDFKIFLVEAESLSLDDEFMKHQPSTAREQSTKDLITEVINSHVKNFYRPLVDPGYKWYPVDVSFIPGLTPVRYNSHNQWASYARCLTQDKWCKCRLGTRLEYGAFLGVLIKTMIEQGYSVKNAWNAVCNDSSVLGHYWGFREESFRKLKPTGSHMFCGFYDLANTRKMLAYDEEANGLWLTGGDFRLSGERSPIAELSLYKWETDCPQNTTGWLVFFVDDTLGNY